MKGFNRCTNGHFYKEDLITCPHCIDNGAAPQLEKTNGDLRQEANLDKTQVFQQGGSNSLETQFTGSDDATKIFGAGSPVPSGVRDLDKTYIGGITENQDNGETVSNTPRLARKIVGWLVSFTLDPMGVDYRIYEGNNSIGKDPKNTITISSDPSISGDHVNILFRRGQFHIKDKMTTNGTFLNDIDMEVEKAYELKDGDEVKMGDTIFIFKTWY